MTITSNLIYPKNKKCHDVEQEFFDALNWLHSAIKRNAEEGVIAGLVYKIVKFGDSFKKDESEIVMGVMQLKTTLFGYQNNECLIVWTEKKDGTVDHLMVVVKTNWNNSVSGTISGPLSLPKEWFLKRMFLMTLTLKQRSNVRK